MNKGALIYEGKGKKLFVTDDENLLISEFKDDLTAFNAEKEAMKQEKAHSTVKSVRSCFIFWNNTVSKRIWSKRLTIRTN